MYSIWRHCLNNSTQPPEKATVSEPVVLKWWAAVSIWLSKHLKGCCYVLVEACVDLAFEIGMFSKLC